MSGSERPRSPQHFAAVETIASHPVRWPGGFLPRIASLAALALAVTAAPMAARAQDAILSRGDAVVTGFSGIKPNPAPLAKGADPLDEFFIDLDGTSAEIQPLAAAGPPQGQLLPASPKLRIRAGQVGQVNAIALDDGLEQRTPNIYLGATSAYGLQIVLPDSDGDGAPERTRKGAPGAQWMAGQFGDGGGPGSIWKVDARGGVSLFAALPDNSGPGIGDIAFDRNSQQFFASNLDNGRIYRISMSGEVLDSFDHGLAGQPAVADDGSQIDVASPSFDTQDPATWALTAPARRVHGLAVREGRLYYATDSQVWSIAVSASGFDGNTRWELDTKSADGDEANGSGAKGLAGDGPVTDLLFDGQGRMVLAQRGAQRASYDYSVFAEPDAANVVRYRREEPDNPQTPSVWVADPETYAIGLPPEHNRAEGGIALGYGHDGDGALRVGACGEMLWSTGHRLRPSIDDPEVTEVDVHGLQGNDVALVRPQNTPPQQSYFVDYDGLFGDAAKSGHVGDVEIWQPCQGAPDYASAAPAQPGPFPPGVWPPGILPPPEFPPPAYDYHTNLKLKKRATPKLCSHFFGGWLCKYTVRVTNTGPDHYFGPIVLRDWLPAHPPGALMGFNWTCAVTGPSDNLCWKFGVFLAPTQSIDMIAYAWVPDSYDKCHLTNAARIVWAPGGSIWNSDPTDDMDFASAIIPSDKCDPDKKKTDLKIYKENIADCFEWNGGIRCGYMIRVENQGPGPYNGNIVVEDTIPNGATAIFSGPAGSWNFPCANAGNVYTCTYPNASLPLPGDGVNLIARVDLPKPLAKQLGCKVPNEAKITFAPGGSNQNTDPTNDDASAVANVPAKICNPPLKESNLKIVKIAPHNAACIHAAGDWCRTFKITVTNTGPDAFNGIIKVTDTPSTGTITAFNAPAWTCAGNTCQTNAAVPLQKNPPSADEVFFSVTVYGSKAEAKAASCKLTNTAKIDSPLGVPQNVVAPDDTSQVTVDLPAELCNTPEEKTNLKLEKQVDANGCLPGDGVFHCYYNIIVTNTGPGTYSDKIVVNEFIPVGTTAVFTWPCMGGTCTKNGVVLQMNEKVVMGAQINVPVSAAKALKCKVLNLAKITYAPGGGNQNTDASDDQDQATANLPAHLCADESPQLCPPGFTWDGERCDRPDPRCRPRWTPTPVAGKCCPPGQPWNKRLGQCGGDTPPPPPECPAGMTTTSVAGKCCPPGQPWNKRLGQCGGDTPPPPPECPDGFKGTPPNCRKMIVDPPPTRHCPPGRTGRFPNCKKIVVDPPKHCPTGTRGTFPRCRPILPKHCPAGTFGKFPRCKPIVKPCPQGMVGRPPNCHRIHRPGRGPGFKFPGGKPPRFNVPGGNPPRLMMRPNFGGRGLR